MRFLRKHRWRLALLIPLFVVGAIYAFISRMEGEITSPPRRGLMDYHRDFLNSPRSHGMRIESFTASDGTPCLVVTPDGTTAGELGMKLRAQLTGRGIRLRPFGELIGNLVLVHGRKGRKEDYLGIAARFTACGFRCVIPDMPAHGDHPLEHVTYGVREAPIPALVLEEAARRYGFSASPCGIMGISMGGSVSMHAAALPDAPWRALVVVASFDSLRDVVRGQTRQRLGNTLGPMLAGHLEKHHRSKTGVGLENVRPADLATLLHVPTLIAHGTVDMVVPMASGRRLYDSLPEGLAGRWIEIPDAGHDDVLITDYPIYAEMAAWFLTHVAGS